MGSKADSGLPESQETAWEGLEGRGGNLEARIHLGEC